MTQPQRFKKPFAGDPTRIERFKEFVRDYWQEHHFSPDLAEICAAMGGLSTSTVNYYRERLEHDGWLEPQARPRLPRSFVPTEIFANRPVFPVLDGIDDLHAPMIHYEKE